MSISHVHFLPAISPGGEDMVKGDLWHEIHSRRKLKESKKSIARAMQLDIKTVRRILRQKKPEVYSRARQESRLLGPHREYILQRLAAVGYCAQAIYEELQVRGYQGSYDIVKRFVSPLRKEADIEATVRFETPPGRQGQADWGQCWTIVAGRRVKVHLFVLTLGYSRRMYAVATADEKMPAFLRSHEEAFEFLGGVTHEIVYDNLRSVVLGRDFEGSRFEWNPVFWDFSRYYGFRPAPHRPYRPQTKGKVESGVKYVKRFLRGKEFTSLDDLNAQLLDWIVTFADQRIHGTTHRKPAEMFLEEKDLLLSVKDRRAYALEERSLRYVPKDCLVAYQTNRYSVPCRLAGKRVEVLTDGEMIKIYHSGELVSCHPRLEGAHQSSVDRTHYVGLIKAAKPAAAPQDDVEVRDLAVYERLAEGGAL
ncbi:MAG: IS21 family transposase [Candidatus Aminicenantes bacterium]|nr:IS21 family transposase [Candidatus Aminicenantes bacterium]